MRVQFERFNNQLDDLDNHLLLLGFIIVSESTFASTQQLTTQTCFLMNDWYQLYYVGDNGLFASMVPTKDKEELKCFFVNQSILIDQIKSSRKRLLLILKNYPAIDLQELCAEAFKPSRVAYSLSLDSDYEFD